MNDPSAASAETLRAPARSRGPELLLYALQSPINIGMILRVAESYQFGVSIYDPHAVLAHPGKLATIGDFSCGALARQGFRNVADQAALTEFLRHRRLVATSIERSTVTLPDFRFQRDDLIALGNEYDGLPDEVLAS